MVFVSHKVFLIVSVVYRVHTTCAFCLVLSWFIYGDAQFLGTFAKLLKDTIMFCHVCMSARPRGTTGLPMDGFS